MEGRCGRNNIDDTVECAHLMEVDLFQCSAVDFRFGDRQEPENGDCIVNHLLRQAALADYAADLPQPTVMFMAVHFSVWVMVMLSMAVPMIVMMCTATIVRMAMAMIVRAAMVVSMAVAVVVMVMAVSM